MFRMFWRLDGVDVEVQRADRDHHDAVYLSAKITVDGEERSFPVSDEPSLLGGNLHSGDRIPLGGQILGPFLVLPDSHVTICVKAVNCADIESAADQVVAATHYVHEVDAVVYKISGAAVLPFAAAMLAGAEGAVLIPGAVIVAALVVDVLDDVVTGIAGLFTNPHCNGPVLTWIDVEFGARALFDARSGAVALSTTGAHLTSPEDCGAAPSYKMHYAISLDPTPSPGEAAAVGRRPGQLDLFWVGAAGQIRATWLDEVFTPHWAAPVDVTPLGSTDPGTGVVTAVARDLDNMNLAWVGPQGQVQAAAWAYALSHLEEIAPAGNAAPGPVAQVSRHPQRLDLFWIGPQGQIQSALWDERQKTPELGWNDILPFPGQWVRFPGVCKAGSAAPGALCAVARRMEHMDLFWVGPSGQLRTTWWDLEADQGRWHDPFDIAGPGSAQPGAVSAVARNIEHLDVVWIGPQGQVRWSFWDSGFDQGRWQPPKDIGEAGQAAFGGIRCVARRPDQLDVFWIGPGGQIRHASWNAASGGDGWQPPEELADNAEAEPGSLHVVARTPERLDVFWTGRLGRIRRLAFDSAVGEGRWQSSTVVPPRIETETGIVVGLSAEIATAQHMLATAAQLLADHQKQAAALTARSAVSVLRDVIPSPEHAAEHWSVLSTGLQAVAAADDTADDLGADAVAAAGLAVATGADAVQTARTLLDIATRLSGAQSLRAAQSAVEILRAADPHHEAPAAAQAFLAQALHTVVSKMIGLGDLSRLDEVAALAVLAHQQAAVAAGADLPSLAADLDQLTIELASARPHVSLGTVISAAAAAQQVRTPGAVTITPQFVSWTAADPVTSVAVGNLHGGAVELRGPLNKAFFLHDDYHGFNADMFSPRLSATGMIELAGGPGHQFTLTFATPLHDPVIHLGSLGSILSFEGGPLTTRLSGDSGFRVLGDEVVGHASDQSVGGLNDSNGTIGLAGAFSTLSFSLIPNFGDQQQTDGVFFQIGGTVPSGTDPLEVARYMTGLSQRLSDAGQFAPALDTQQAVIDTLQGFTPSEDGRLDYLLTLAEARQNLMIRLIDLTRFAQATALTETTIAAYHDYAAAPGSDKHRAAADLIELARRLSLAGLSTDADSVHHAADEITGP